MSRGELYGPVRRTPPAGLGDSEPRRDMARLHGHRPPRVQAALAAWGRPAIPHDDPGAEPVMYRRAERWAGEITESGTGRPSRCSFEDALPA